MSEYSRGSEWRKWDFQVHTPYSILHNKYKFDPNDEIEDDCQDPFDNYVKILFEKAIDYQPVDEDDIGYDYDEEDDEDDD